MFNSIVVLVIGVVIIIIAVYIAVASLYSVMVRRVLREIDRQWPGDM